MVRSEQNWIGGSGLSPADAEFIPPPPELVGESLEDLVAFVNRDDLPASLQAAAAHAQFETIHPFVDGNGRVGRCLIHVVLRRSKIAPAVVPPISLILAASPGDYVRALGAWRGEEPVEWCLFFAGVATTSVRATRGLASMVGRLHAEWLARAGNPRQDSSARRLIEQLTAEPIVSVARAMELTATSRPAADRAIARLERAAVLRPVGSRRRNRQWEAREVFELLDRFERQVATPDAKPPGDSAVREGRSINAIATEILDAVADSDQGDRRARLRSAAVAAGTLRPIQARRVTAARRRRILDSTRGLGRQVDHLLAHERARM